MKIAIAGTGYVGLPTVIPLAPKKAGCQEIGYSLGGLAPKLHVVVDCRLASADFFETS